MTDVTLRRPTARPYPDAFWREFAATYERLAKKTLSPNKAIADAAAVPVKTVRAWTTKARRLGYLPEGVQGRAGGPDDGLRTCPICHGRGKTRRQESA